MKTLSLGLLVLLVGCEPQPEEPYPPPGLDWRVVYVDGCQYVELRGSEKYAFTHKGDCTNPVHNPQ